jgi:hypothetical protein
VHYRESSEYGSRLALASLAWPGRQKKSKRKRPCSLRRGGVGFPFFSLRQNRRGRSAGRRNVLVSALREPLGEEARAIRRSIAAISDHGPGFLGRGRRLRDCVSQSQSSEAPRRRILVSAGRGPVASRAPACEAGPRAPHPLSPSKRLATAPFGGPDGVIIFLGDHGCQGL